MVLEVIAGKFDVGNGTSRSLTRCKSEVEEGTGSEGKRTGWLPRCLVQESVELPGQIALRAGLMNLPELDHRPDSRIDSYRGIIEDTAKLTTVMKSIHGSAFSNKRKRVTR